VIVIFDVEGSNRNDLVAAAIKRLDGFVSLPCNGYGFSSRRSFVDAGITATEARDSGIRRVVIPGEWVGHVSVEV